MEVGGMLPAHNSGKHTINPRERRNETREEDSAPGRKIGLNWRTHRKTRRKDATKKPNLRAEGPEKGSVWEIDGCVGRIRTP